MIIPELAPTPPAWSAPFIAIPRTVKTSEANWIWAHGPDQPAPTAKNAPVGTFVFTRRFEAREITPDATLWCAADNHAEIWLNDQKIGETTDEYRSWTKIPVRAHLKLGANEVRVRATNSPGGASNPGGLVLKIPGVVATGGDWTAADDAGRPATTVALGGETMAPWSLSDEELRPPLFRKSFSLRDAPRRARIRLIGLGDYRLYVNGRDISDEFLLQAWTQYDKSIAWREFDVARFLKKGENVICALMGNSYYYAVNPGGNRYAKGDALPRFGETYPYLFSADLAMAFPDGATQTLTTDDSWMWAYGPITFSHVQGGEDFDPNLWPAGWNKAAASTSEWRAASLAPTPEVRIEPATAPPIVPKQSFRPVRVLHRPHDVVSVDFGQNMSGILEFEVEGESGRRILIRPSEVMTDEGDVQQLNLWGRSAHCVYTLKGGRPESHRWRFWYHGFRYAAVEGVVRPGDPNPRGLPVLRSIRAIHIRADNSQIGAFRTQPDLLERTHTLIDWAMRSNMTHSMTDCPHREKMGWLECSYLLAPTFAYRYETKSWFEKICRDIRDAQRPNGLIPTVAPRYLMRPDDDDYAFTVEWGAAGVLLPWHVYRWTGDQAILKESYASMRGFVDYVTSRSDDHIAPKGLGDWYDYGHGEGPGPSRFTPVRLTSTATQAMCLDALARTADLLGHADDAARYRAEWTNVRNAFLREFYDPATKTTKNSGSPQTGIAIALEANLIPEADREATLEALLRDLEARGYQQTPGDVGHVYFVRALARMGRSDVLHRVYSRTGVGSYGGILAKGLTALPETWDAITVGSNSLNHCMLGHAMEWFYGYVLGIRQAEDSVGWSKIVIGPNFGELRSARGETGTPRGKVKVAWTRSKSGARVTVTLPTGVGATFVPPPGYALVEGDTTLRGGTSTLRLTSP